MVNDWRFYINSQADYKDLHFLEESCPPVLFLKNGEYIVGEAYRDDFIFLRKQEL